MIEKEIINKLCNDIYLANKAKGFWSERESVVLSMESASNDFGERIFTIEEVEAVKKAFIAQMIALQHSELSEALEADRKDLMDDKLPHRKGLEVELVDAAIRIFDMAGGLGMDLGGAMIEKLDYNETRPYKHGKKY